MPHRIGKTGDLIGGIGLTEIHRGIWQKATLGYWIGKPYARQGYMTEAVRLICEFAFDKLGLHRVEASCTPNNEASKKLLQRLGFAEEGFARTYAHINGKWEDYVLWAKAQP